MLDDLIALPEWHEVCKRYRYDITRFAVEALNMTEKAGQAVTPQQEMLFASIQVPGSRTSVASGHGTGKSRSAGIIALWHLLFYPQSVMLFTAPQIGQLKTVVWKEISICLERLKQSHLAWLADYVVMFSEKIYIKGYDKTWFVFAKTAPKHNPTNIAGQHGDYYMVWADEACGIDDAVMEVAIGALTHANNRAVLTSQPARGAGFFYDTHHRLSHKAGGQWVALKFNGELSPIVSRQKLIEALQQYGDRNHPGYLIRIRGEFPELKGEYLITRSEVENMLKNKPVTTNENFGYIITVDVGGAVGRDSTVVTVAEVVDKMVNGRVERFCHIVDIPLHSNTAQIHQIRGLIHDLINTYDGASLIIDPVGSGTGLCQALRADGVFLTEVHWGGACFKQQNRRYYTNKKAHAYVNLSRAIEQGRFSMADKIKYITKTQLSEQLIKIPYTFDDNARFKLMSKNDMKKKGIHSPDIADTLAFLFLEGVYYAPVGTVNVTQKEQSDWQELENYFA